MNIFLHQHLPNFKKCSLVRISDLNRLKWKNKIDNTSLLPNSIIALKIHIVISSNSNIMKRNLA